MNKRLRLVLAAYLALWVAVAGSIIYGIVRAGYPGWLAVASVFLLFTFVNGTLAYKAHARRLKLEGTEPPPYLRYLLFPQGFPRLGEQAPAAAHFFVGTAALITGLFFAFCSVALALDAEWTRVSQPLVVSSICVALAGLGAVFLYLAWRLFTFSRRPPTNVA